VKRLTDRLQIHAAEWTPKIAYFAVFGLTGLTVAGLYHGYKAIRNKNERLEFNGFEDPTED
jgi:hypothetical protein